MLRWIIRTSLAGRPVVLVVAAGLMAFGVTQARNASVDVLPEFKPPYVEVQTEALGLSAVEVEQLITSPLEADLLNGVAFLDEIGSESVAGLSSIQLYFEPGTDVLQARQLVQERLTEARALPNVSKAPAMLQPLSSTGRVMMVGLKSEDLSLIEMSVLARWKIRPRLMGVPGVANVAIWGQRERQLQVQVDPERLRQNGVSLNQVISTTANALWSSPLSFVEASTPGTGGFIETPQQRLGIQHVLPITTPEDLAQVSVEDVEGRRLTIGDIASVREDHQPLIGDALVEDEPGLMLVIEKFPGSNTPEVTRQVEEALQTLSPGLPGLQMDTKIFQPASFIDSALDNLGTAVLLAGILVFLLLAFLLLAWRVAVTTMVAIALSLTAAIVVLQWMGTTFNALILVGLVVALGVVIDEAITTSDLMGRRLRERRHNGGGPSAPSVVVDAALEVRRPLLPATVVVLAMAVPVYVAGGLDGSFLRPAVEAYVLAIMAAFLVAVTVTPALALTLLSRAPTHGRRPPLARLLQRGYQPALGRVLRRAPFVWAAVAVALVAGLAILPQLGGDRTIPTANDRDVLVRWDAPPGTSLPAMESVVANASRELRQTDGVRSVAAHVGRAVTSDQVVGVNSGELWIGIEPGADVDETLVAVRRTLAGHPEFSRDVLAYTDQRIDELGVESDEPVVVRVYGEDLAPLRDKAREVRGVLDGVEGVVGPRINLSPNEPTLEVEVDLAKAQKFGIKPGDVRRAAATLLSGIQVGNLFEEQKVFDVVVWGTPQVRDSVESIRDLLIDTPGGGHARLEQVADVRLSSSPNVIAHDSVSRYVDVVADVRGRDVGSVVDDVETGLGSVEFPLEYHAEVLGDYAERQADNLRVMVVGVAAALALLLLLQAASGSWRVAGLLFVTLPVALLGGMLAAWLLGDPLAWTTLLGVGTVLGITVRNTMGLVADFQAQARRRRRPAHAEDVAEAARERLVPVASTAIATALALLPVVVIGAEQGLEVIHPIAVVVLAGLVTSTLYTLFVVPALYLRHAPRTPPGTYESVWEVSLPGQVDHTQRETAARSISDAPR